MVILSICLILAVLVFSVSHYIYREAFFSHPKAHPTPDVEMHGSQYQKVRDHIYRMAHIMEQYPYESVTIHSHDGLKLHGRYYHLHDGAPIEIICHGYRSHPYRDCSGGHALSRKLGFNALVIASAGGVIKLPSERVSLSDGVMELFLIRMPKTPLDLQRIATALLSQDPDSCPLIELHHVKSVRVLLDDNLSWSLDGEEAMGGRRVEIRCLHSGVRLKTPQ